MLNELGRDYLIFTFAASLGTLQVVAALNRLSGVMFFSNRAVSFIAGLAVALAAFIWFFNEPRNLPDTSGGINGNQQAGLFALGAGIAVVVTLMSTSVINIRLRIHGESQQTGFDALRNATFISALLPILRRLWGTLLPLFNKQTLR